MGGSLWLLDNGRLSCPRRPRARPRRPLKLAFSCTPSPVIACLLAALPRYLVVLLLLLDLSDVRNWESWHLAPVNGDTFKLPGSRNCSSRYAPSNVLSVSAIHHTLLSLGESCVSAARPCARLRYVCALSLLLRPRPLALALPMTRDHPCSNRTRPTLSCVHSRMFRGYLVSSW